MRDLFTKSNWRRVRVDSFTSARQCKNALTDPAGFYCYSEADERVATAMNAWVDRARNAHAIVMGRKPIVSSFVYIGPEGSGCSQVWACETKEAV